MSSKIIMIIAAILLALGAGYFISQQSDNDDPVTQPSSQNESANSGSGSQGETLDLTGQQLTTLPESALSNPDITTLNVSNNQLTSLPADIAKLSNLEVLNVENNRLESLPAELSQLTKLREIKANNNRMTSLPEDLGAMTQLQILDISGNSIPAGQVEALKTRLVDTEIKN